MLRLFMHFCINYLVSNVSPNLRPPLEFLYKIYEPPEFLWKIFDPLLKEIITPPPYDLLKPPSNVVKNVGPPPSKEEES